MLDGRIFAQSALVGKKLGKTCSIGSSSGAQVLKEVVWEMTAVDERKGRISGRKARLLAASIQCDIDWPDMGRLSGCLDRRR